jgi:hypothetical protein
MARSRRRKVGMGCGGLILLLVILFFALPTRKIVFPKHYDVVPITAAPEYKDKARLDRARVGTGLSAYPSPPLYQSNGSICGPTSLANVFRSYGDTATTVDDVLAASGKCSLGICFMGLTLDELAAVAGRRQGYRVTVIRDLSLQDLRAHLKEATDPKRRYVVNFDRGPLFGKEGGHHSPIGGYLAEEDLALVLDVNAKYEPWLVKMERLFSAVDTIDPISERKRGLLMIEKDPYSATHLK